MRAHRKIWLCACNMQHGSKPACQLFFFYVLHYLDMFLRELCIIKSVYRYDVSTPVIHVSVYSSKTIGGAMTNACVTPQQCNKRIDPRIGVHWSTNTDCNHIYFEFAHLHFNSIIITEASKRHAFLKIDKN